MIDLSGWFISPAKAAGGVFAKEIGGRGHSEL
jgi:hypothetical protein